MSNLVPMNLRGHNPEGLAAATQLLLNHRIIAASPTAVALGRGVDVQALLPAPPGAATSSSSSTSNNNALNNDTPRVRLRPVPRLNRTLNRRGQGAAANNNDNNNNANDNPDDFVGELIADFVDEVPVNDISDSDDDLEEDDLDARHQLAPVVMPPFQIPPPPPFNMPIQERIQQQQERQQQQQLQQRQYENQHLAFILEEAVAAGADPRIFDILGDQLNAAPDLPAGWGARPFPPRAAVPNAAARVPPVLTPLPRERREDFLARQAAYRAGAGAGGVGVGDADVRRVPNPTRNAPYPRLRRPAANERNGRAALSSLLEASLAAMHRGGADNGPRINPHPPMPPRAGRPGQLAPPSRGPPTLEELRNAPPTPMEELRMRARASALAREREAAARGARTHRLVDETARRSAERAAEREIRTARSQLAVDDARRRAEEQRETLRPLLLQGQGTATAATPESAEERRRRAIAQAVDRVAIRREQAVTAGILPRADGTRMTSVERIALLLEAEGGTARTLRSSSSSSSSSSRNLRPNNP